MTVWLVMAAFILVIFFGVAIDLTGQANAQQRVHDVAAQAARAGGQQLNAAQAVRGLGVKADPYAAAQAARTYLAASGVEGTVSVEGGTTVRVRTSDVYSTKIVSIVGIGNMRVTGEAEARVVRAVGGTEQ
ncbi:pilus assembly protein TadG-related protein [Cellulosimicrobium protaetiae]|uniref:pilus assembly protein TadG-related protein n=1 Tax=Cellulosimicrobium protaetiae TaxID=2587808 RepID=UPI0020A2C7C2|nr:pilus assembly protein TadG-related protein [Cellulosimicrobium protaetiae]